MDSLPGGPPPLGSSEDLQQFLHQPPQQQPAEAAAIYLNGEEPVTMMSSQDAFPSLVPLNPSLEGQQGGTDAKGLSLSGGPSILPHQLDDNNNVVATGGAGTFTAGTTTALSLSTTGVGGAGGSDAQTVMAGGTALPNPVTGINPLLAQAALAMMRAAASRQQQQQQGGVARGGGGPLKGGGLPPMGMGPGGINAAAAAAALARLAPGFGMGSSNNSGIIGQPLASNSMMWGPGGSPLKGLGGGVAGTNINPGAPNPMGGFFGPMGSGVGPGGAPINWAMALK